MAHQRLDLRV